MISSDHYYIRAYQYRHGDGCPDDQTSSIQFISHDSRGRGLISVLYFQPAPLSFCPLTLPPSPFSFPIPFCPCAISHVPFLISGVPCAYFPFPCSPIPIQADAGKLTSSGSGSGSGKLAIQESRLTPIVQSVGQSRRFNTRRSLVY